MRAKYRVAVSLSGRTNNFENNNEDGYFLFTYYGNVRTTEKSAIAAVKRICSLGGCKVESVKAIEKNEVCL